MPPEAMRATWSMTVAPRPRKTRRGRAACGGTGARRAQGAAAQARSLLGCGLLRARRRRGRGARVAMDAVGRCASVARREAVESVMSERGAPLATGRRGGTRGAGAHAGTSILG